MALNLNEIQKYRDFNGSKTSQMPLLVNGTDETGKVVDVARTPMSVAVLMERRICSKLGDWMDNYFNSGDSIAYSTGRNFKVVLDAPQLRSINPKTKLQIGALILGENEEAYKSLDAEEFDRDKLILEKPLTEEEVRAHPLWLKLARGDKSLLNAYVDKIFADARQKFNYNTNMCFYLTSPQNVPTMRAFYVGRLGCRSDADGWSDLGDDVGRLVGVAPEAPSAFRGMVVTPTLEQCLDVINNSIGNLEIRKK